MTTTYYATIIDIRGDGFNVDYVRGSLTQVKAFVSCYRFQCPGICVMRVHGNAFNAYDARHNAVPVVDFDFSIYTKTV